MLLGCLSVTTVYSQYQIKSWTTDDGLPQNTVHSIVQTRDGYLWLTTLDGLVRYDGVKFTVFNKNNSPGIVSNRLTKIAGNSKNKQLLEVNLKEAVGNEL